MPLSLKARSIALLMLAEVAGMSLWFISAAVIGDMAKDVAITPFRQALLSSAVQAGFVVGALVSAILGIPDRIDPRRVFAASAIGAGCANGLLLVVVPGSDSAIAARFLTGALLAGVYPVGMKIAVGWGQKDRGLLIGALVGALTLGSAAPHLLALVGGSRWQITVSAASLAAIAAGIICIFVALGPHHATAARFDPKAIGTAWTNKRVRYAYLGYLGHMWELYAMWAWIAAAVGASYALAAPESDSAAFAKLTAFTAIAAGALSCIPAGLVADRIGKAEVTIIAMAMSGLSAIAVAITYGAAPWITFAFTVLWGLSIVADSAQFSALVADAAPPHQAGSLMTLQTALGFALTTATVQLTPILASRYGWPPILAALALGPALGIIAMQKYRRLA